MRPRNGKKYHQGTFTPRHPEKYVGDVKNIVYRSGWELRVMMKFDMDPNVLKWASEETVIQYYDPVQQKPRRYFPDFLVKLKNGQVVMVEVKPEAQQVIPRKGKKSQKRFISEANTYLTNEAKWEAAREFCRKKGWKFEVLNERDLGIRRSRSR